MANRYHLDAAAPSLHQRGALIVMFALTLVVMLGFTGLALDLAQVYNRKTELQNLADGAALAAANALDGSVAGLARAQLQAQTAAAGRKYAYSAAVAWDDAALTFSSAPDSPDTAWVTAGAGGANPALAATLLFAKVDTSKLADHGRVATAFMAALSPALASATTNGRAVAGRTELRVTPLGICALEPATPAGIRLNSVGSELVEFGFRRGVGYNLRNLSAAGATPLHFLIDPIAPGGGGANFSTAAVAPFVCSGSMPVVRLPATVHVQYPFPAALSDQLNARFNTYLGTPACNPVAAPPDSNVRPYLPTAPVWWTVTSGTGTVVQTAAAATSAAGHLVTVADLPGAAINAGAYGVLWSYATAVQYAAAEPAGGYLPFLKANWNALYPVLSTTPPVVASSYPTAPKTPYSNNYLSGAFFLAPVGNPGQRERRVLNLPLLRCPDASGANTTAAVLAVGRFFMTAPASASAISAEFAGLVAPQALGGAVRLYQ